MGVLVSLCDLCKKGKKDPKTTPSARQQFSDKGPDALRPHCKSQVGELDYCIKDLVPPDELLPAIVDDSLTSVPTVTNIGAFNNDDYFTEEDNKYYKQKYANEKIEHKAIVKIKYSLFVLFRFVIYAPSKKPHSPM